MSALYVFRLACCRYALSRVLQSCPNGPRHLQYPQEGCSAWPGQRWWWWWGSFWLCQTQLCHNIFTCLSYLFSVWLLCVNSHAQFSGCCLIWLMPISHISTFRWGLMASSLFMWSVLGKCPQGTAVCLLHTNSAYAHICVSQAIAEHPPRCSGNKHKAQSTGKPGNSVKGSVQGQCYNKGRQQHTLEDKTVTISQPSWGL